MIIIFDLDNTLFDTSGQLDETYSNLSNIKLFPDAKEVLDKLDCMKVLVTRARPGLEETQQKKIDILGIRDYFEEIFLCSTNEDKKKAFEDVLDKNGVSPDEIVVVGDRIDAEIHYGNELGMRTVQMVHGKYKDLKPQNNYEKPDFEITTLRELLQICKQ